MTQFLVRRILLAVPTLVVAATLAFVLLRMVPGDALTVMFDSGQYSEQDMEVARERLGLDDPLVVQYGKFMRDMATGDFGTSMWSGRSVANDLFKDKLPVTLELTFFSILFGIALGIPAGTIAALRQGSVWDHGVRMLAVAGISIPGFWIGTMVVILPAVWWGWSLPIGFDSPVEDPWAHTQQVIIPALVMSLILVALLMRMARSMMLEVLRQDYVRTATSKGLRGQVVIIRHCLRNAMLPLISIIGVQAAVLLSGTVVYETVFSIPGVGLYLFDGLSRRDYPVVEAVVVMLTVGVILINVLVDVSYRILDPRVKLS